MKKLEFSHIENVNGGGFCSAFGATVAVYGVGVYANLWNPVGWGGALTIAGVAVACAAYHWGE